MNAEPARTQAQFSFDWPAVASRLVAQLAPRPGEKILILAHPGMFEALIPHLRYAIARAGATDVGVEMANPFPPQRMNSPVQSTLEMPTRER